MKFNIYWLMDEDKSLVNDDLTLDEVLMRARTILTQGGEITSIINVEDDR